MFLVTKTLLLEIKIYVFKDLFQFYADKCLPAHVYGHHVHDWCQWVPEEGDGFPGKQVVVSCSIELGLEPRSSVRAPPALHHGAISRLKLGILQPWCGGSCL